METWATDSLYNLSSPKKILNKSEFDRILNDYIDKKLLLVFWSAKAAGSTLIDNLPALRAFEENHGDKIKMIFICIDKLENRDLWAARIMYESWKMDHYFLPKEGNEDALKACTDEDIDSLCNGGTTFTYINQEGEMFENVQPPYQLKKEEITFVYK